MHIKRCFEQNFKLFFERKYTLTRTSFLFKIIVCMHVFILGSAGSLFCVGSSLVAESRGCTLPAALWLLADEPSLVAEHRL